MIRANASAKIILPWYHGKPLSEKVISVIKRTFCTGSSWTVLDSAQAAVAICQGERWAEIHGEALPSPHLLTMPCSELPDTEYPWEAQTNPQRDRFISSLKDCRRKIKQDQHEKYIHEKLFRRCFFGSETSGGCVFLPTMESLFKLTMLYCNYFFMCLPTLQVLVPRRCHFLTPRTYHRASTLEVTSERISEWKCQPV